MLTVRTVSGRELMMKLTSAPVAAMRRKNMAVATPRASWVAVRQLRVRGCRVYSRLTGEALLWKLFREYVQAQAIPLTQIATSPPPMTAAFVELLRLAPRL